MKPMTKRDLIRRAKNKYPNSAVCITTELWHYKGERKPAKEIHKLYITELSKYMEGATILALAVAAGLAPEVDRKSVV